ncbi:hypothetical protein SH661x_001507 [Planctomicrobium sp. SH661]|uniref:hypothetical protein n=1 Tax=Planctomicrobium sp. SH661 TaxID=3448124 RepID=UPI003F5CB533
MLRFGFIYSCFMIVAGSSLLAELPTGPVPAEPKSFHADAEPTLAKTRDQEGTAAPSRVENPIPAAVSRAYFEENGPYTPAPPRFLLPETQRVAEEHQAQQTAAEAEFYSDGPAPSMAILREKQKQLQALQMEIAELEKRLGVAKQYQVECFMGEVSMDQLRKLDPEIQWDDKSLSVVNFIEQADQGRSLPVQQFRAIEACLMRTGSMKALMSPKLVTSARQPASLRAGGEFPVQTASGEKANVDMWEFGEKFSTLVEPLAENRVRISVSPEHVERDLKHAVKVNGQVIPGLRTRAFAFDAEMEVGSTLVRTMVSSREKNNTAYTLLAVTVTAVQPLETAAEQPRLEPIPETETR